MVSDHVLALFHVKTPLDMPLSISSSTEASITCRSSCNAKQGSTVCPILLHVLVTCFESNISLNCRYAAIVVDEAHERSINTDVILGLLKRDAPKFPNLKVCVTSATIETQLFRDFFGQAACLDIPGRMYPVVIKHMPIPDSDDLSRPVISAVLRILDETASAAAAASCNVGLNMPGDDEQVQSPGDLSNKGGDVLVFLTGQVGTSG